MPLVDWRSGKVPLYLFQLSLCWRRNEPQAGLETCVHTTRAGIVFQVLESSCCYRVRREEGWSGLWCGCYSLLKNNSLLQLTLGQQNIAAAAKKSSLLNPWAKQPWFWSWPCESIWLHLEVNPWLWPMVKWDSFRLRSEGETIMHDGKMLKYSQTSLKQSFKGPAKMVRLLTRVHLLRSRRQRSAADHVRVKNE